MTELLIKEKKKASSQSSDSDDDLMNDLLDQMDDYNNDQQQTDNVNDDKPVAIADDDDDTKKDINDNKDKDATAAVAVNDDDNKNDANKITDTQRKYFQDILNILTELDLTEVDEDKNNQISMKELKDYISANNIQIPEYLTENIFYSIDNDGNGEISPIEYLKWKVRVTVDDIIALTNTVGKPNQNKDDAKDDAVMDDDDDADDDDDDLAHILSGSSGDDGVLDILELMDEEEEKKERNRMLDEMEQAALRQKQELLEEAKKRKEWLKKEKIRKELEAKKKKAHEEKMKKERDAIANERKQLELEKEEREIEEKKNRIAAIMSDAKKLIKNVSDNHSDSERNSSDSDDDSDGDSDFDTSTESSDWEDDQFSAHHHHAAVDTSTFSKLCPCCVFNKDKGLSRQKSSGNDLGKNIVVDLKKTKSRLIKFILRYGDIYLDDGNTMSMKNEKIDRLCKDVDFNDKTGVYFWALVLDRQAQKAYDCLWPVLRYVARELPTPIAVELINLYRVELSRYLPSKIESVTREIVDASKFPIATALVIASYFKERAESDLANTKQLSEYSELYQNLAAEELRHIESDYLATMAMQIKSFHSSKTPFDIAVENELVEFLASDRIGRIGHAMWVKNNLLEPQISDSSFEVRDVGIVEIVRELSSPRKFYFTPMGFYFTETFLFIIYLGIFTVITLIGVNVSDDIPIYEWILYICNFGFVFNEVVQFLTEGPSQYFSTWENAVDITVCFNWILIMFLRVGIVIIIEAISEEGEEGEGVDVPYFNNDQSSINLIFQCLWVLNIILLWIRCIHFLMLSNQTGPLINVTKSMISDVMQWLKVFIIISIGFLYAMYFLVGDTNEYFSTEVRSATFTILAAFGQPNWLHVFEGGNSDSIEELSFINKWIVVIYSIIGFVLLMNLLIAMMAESYSRTEGQSAKEVLLNKNSLAYELDLSAKIMPPPWNSLLFVLFIIYNIIDIIILAFTSEFLNEEGWNKYWRCTNKKCKFLNKKSIINEYIKQGWDEQFPCGLCDQLHNMVHINKSSKRRFRRKARGLEGKKTNFCSRLGHGVKEIFVSKIKWKKHSWSCGWCRSKIPAAHPAELGRYFTKLKRTHNLDSNDVNWVKSMNPSLCPHCYRPRKPRARSTYILENISFIIFVIFIYPLMWFCFWPIYVYDTIKNPNMEKKDHKEFRLTHIQNYSLRPDAATVIKHMPKAYLHQSILSLHHKIWRSLHYHRSTIKSQTLAQSLLSANQRQENVRAQRENRKRKEITKISNLVMDVLSDLSNSRIQWQPSGAELLQRMSKASGVEIDGDWYKKHQTMRDEKARRFKEHLIFESGASKRSKHISGFSQLKIDDDAVDDLLALGSSHSAGDGGSRHSRKSSKAKRRSSKAKKSNQ